MEIAMDIKDQINGQMSLFDILKKSVTAPAAKTQAGKAQKANSDFGKHIGGARKEIWGSRGLSILDLADMNTAECEKYVKKDNIWKKPDYAALAKEGRDAVAVYAIKKIRDALPTSPLQASTEEAKRERREELISFIAAIRDKAMALHAENDLKTLSSWLVDESYVERSGSISGYFTPTKKCYGLLTTKLFNALWITSYTISQYKREITKKQFLVEASQKVPAGYYIRQCTGNGYSRNNDLKPGTFYVMTKQYSIIAENLDTYEEALAFAKNAAKRKGKKRFVPAQLEHVERIGLPDVRQGKDITGQDYLDTFNIRGGEFGEWMSEKDAQASLNMAYESFHDLAMVLDIDPSRISLGGRLSIAFGARGRGNAVAHYEPLREVINLTKMRGAGSLAHEMFHAIDDIAGKLLGLNGMMTESRQEIPESMVKVLEAMKKRPATELEKEQAKAKRIEAAKKRLLMAISLFSCMMDKPLKDEVDMIVSDALAHTETQYASRDLKTASFPFIEKLSDIKKEATGRILSQDERMRIYWPYESYVDAMNYDPSNLIMETNFFLNSKRMDECNAKEDKGYWASSCEMFARAGACYVTDMLKDLGGESDYLSGHSEACVGMDSSNNGETSLIYAMPMGEERKRINSAIKELIDDLKERGII